MIICLAIAVVFIGILALKNYFTNKTLIRAMLKLLEDYPEVSDPKYDSDDIGFI